MTAASEETFGDAVTGKTGKKSKNSKNKGKDFKINLAQVSCIRYLIIFQKQSVSALFNLKHEINTIHPIFVKKLGLFIRPTDIGVRKINRTTLDTYEMVVAVFLVMDKANQVKFFEKIFLVANISLEVVFKMFFLNLSSANVDFLD